MKDGDRARFMDGGSDEREGKGRDKNWIETRLVSRPPIYLGDVVGLLHTTWKRKRAIGRVTKAAKNASAHEMRVDR